MSEPTIVCILGMHRSGTSLVSRILNVLGLELGPDEHLMRPSSDNPTGHWESLPIAELNEEILKRLGGNWAKTPDLVPGWENRPDLDELRKQARELIEADFSGHDLWGFKDPRNSLTLPFWQRILSPMRYVVCLRNPVDVARSLHARREDSVPFEQGVGLWLTYVRAGLAATAGHPRQLVFYEDLMADPEPVIRRLARFIGRQKSKPSKAETRLAIRMALADDLWHHRSPVSNVVDEGRLGFHVKALYLALRLSVRGPEPIPTDALDLLGAHAVTAGDRLAQLEARKTHLEKRLAERRDEIERLRDEHRGHRANLERLAKAREEEKGRREQVEADLRAARAELRDLKSPPPEKQADSGPTSAAGATYDDVLGDIRARAQELIPPGATVLVASKGDDALLRLDGRRGLHFPIAPDGGYAGFHPAGDTAAIAQLEALRARGADHLMLPKTTIWWLDHYRGLRRHLEERYVTLVEDEDCAIYRLDAMGRTDVTGALATFRRVVAALRIRSGRDPSILDWRTQLGIAERFPELAVFAPPDEEPTLPYLDRSVDVVVLASADAARIAEARRVASSAVIRVDPDGPETAELDWLAGGSSEWGEEVGVLLFPDGEEAAWRATIGAVGETLADGFAGDLVVVGDAAALGAAGERAGAPLHTVEVGAGAGLAARARAATEAVERPIQVFVTAPAVPLPDWLPSILTLLHGDERAPGVVGTRIVSRSGALEEAGGVLAANGSRRRRGEGDLDPDRPEYCFVRPVDFCSPPLIATRRDVFERLAGFDEGVTASEAPVDFSLRAGRGGAPVYYQPQVRVVAIGVDGL